MSRIALAILALVIATSTLTAQGPVPPELIHYPDLIVHNGKILTVDENFRTAEAVAIRDGVFLAVGTNQGILPLRGPATRTIDLQGKTVIPGFVASDADNDFVGGNLYKETLVGGKIYGTLRGVDTKEAILNKVREYVAARPRGETIFLRLPDEGAEGMRLTKDDLDPLTPSHPVALNVTSFDMVVNSLMLEKVLAVLPGGASHPSVLKDPNGQPNGQLFGFAMGVAGWDLRPWPKIDDAILQEQKDMFTRLHRRGITSMIAHMQGFGLSIVNVLYHRDELTMRIFAAHDFLRQNPNAEAYLRRLGNLVDFGLGDMVQIVGAGLEAMDGDAPINPTALEEQAHTLASNGHRVLAVAAGWAFAAGATAAPGSGAGQESAQDAYATSTPVELRPPVERATLHLRRPNLRQLYQAISDAYGIRLLYDRELEDPAIVSNFDIADATLREALDAAGSISATFVAPLDERTGIVVGDTVAKRGEYERQVLATFHADDQTTPQQLTEISTALRTLLDLRRITQDTRFNWITVRGLTRQVAVANQFFRTLEKPRGEVFIEAELMEVNTSRARSLGLLPPQPFLLQFLGRAVPGVDATLFALGGGRTFYGVRLPGAAGDLNFASSIVRSYQVLQLRAIQDQEANFLLGSRFPVVTATVGAGFSADPNASLGFFPQIQYQDIGVTVKTTPHLHAGRELTLVLDLAIRDLGARARNGLPTFTNRQVTGQVRLKEGESFLIGGILDRREQNSRTGYPFLSRIPLIGYLFSVFRKQQAETELWIHLRPYILRAAPAEEFASRSIFFGKELPGVTPPPIEAIPPTPPPGAPQPGVVPPGVVPPGVQPPGVQPRQPGQPPQPGAPPEPGAPVVFPPGVFPPGVFPPGVQPPQPGVTPQPGAPGFVPPPGTVQQPGGPQQQR